MEEQGKRIYCKSCINYYITWDKKFPHGCKLWGIKSVQMPSVTVYSSGGIPCGYYKKREVNN